MKTEKFALLLAVMAAAILSSTIAAAGDFEWLKELNVRAKADPAGFVAQVAARFEVGKAKVEAVIGNVDEPADAYMLMRMGEMSKKPVDEVLDRYNTEKGKGWGALAHSLGIKPGSAEFHALKTGHDLDAKQEKGKTAAQGKDKSKSKGKQKSKNKSKGITPEQGKPKGK